MSPRNTQPPVASWPVAWFCRILALIMPALAMEARGGAELIPSPEPGWPQFRGPRRDGVSLERGLLQAWPETGPRALWSADGIGRGYSSPVISGGRLFITGDDAGELHLFAFDLEGKRLWRTANGRAWRQPYPGARSSAAVSDGRVYHKNAHGRMACLDAGTGRELWAVELLERFEAENITWGVSECPIVDEQAVYATAGGSLGFMVALDCRTGEVLWRSSPLHDAARKQVEPGSYVSPILVRFEGRRLLIGCSLRHLYCIDADTGAIQWQVERPTEYSVLAMSPVLVGDAVFMTAPHGPPGALYRLLPPAAPDGDIGVARAWTTPLDTCQGGVVYADGRLYGSYYPGRKGWAALDAVSGEVLYTEPAYAKGAVLHADGRLYALSEDGWMRLLEPTADRFELHGQFRLAEARNDAWAHPVILDGRLYLRYHERLHCYDVRAADGG